MSEIRDFKITQEFLEHAGRAPVKIEFTKNPKCPNCGDDLQLASLKPHFFPYIHADMELHCMMCGKWYIFGVPHSRDAGLALIIWDSNPLEALKKFSSLDTPRCPWGHGFMLKTKIFGDWFKSNAETTRFQWKCPTCYYCHHEYHPRDFPHGLNDPLSEEEKGIDIILKAA